MVLGLGDLGSRVLEGLAAGPRVERLVGTSRRAAPGRAQVNQAALIARMAGSAVAVEHAVVDLDDPATARDALLRHAPDVVVLAAAEHTWWRTPADPELRALPYAAWLPLLLAPVRAFMEARADAGSRARVVCLPYPDAVGPALAGAGLAPTAGAGNVAEIAAKLQVAAAAARGARLGDVGVRVVAHHAAERTALGAFAAVAGDRPGTGPAERAEAPWAAEVRVDGATLPAAEVEALFSAPYALPEGRATQSITAASAVALTQALLGDEPTALHVPAPDGRPGGYPVRVHRGAVQLDLPAGMTEAAAIDVNARAAAWDGLAAVEADGTIVFTPAAAEALTAATGLRGPAFAPADLPGLAAALRERLRR